MNRLILASTERLDGGAMRPLILRPAIDAAAIYADEQYAGEVSFHSDPNGDPLMAVWSEDFEEWSVYYSE